MGLRLSLPPDTGDTFRNASGTDSFAQRQHPTRHRPPGRRWDAAAQPPWLNSLLLRGLFLAVHPRAGPELLEAQSACVTAVGCCLLGVSLPALPENSLGRLEAGESRGRGEGEPPPPEDRAGAGSRGQMAWGSECQGLLHKKGTRKWPRVLGTPVASDADGTGLGVWGGALLLWAMRFPGAASLEGAHLSPFPCPGLHPAALAPEMPSPGPRACGTTCSCGLILGGLPLAEGSSRDAHLWSRTTRAGRPARGTARRLRKGELGVQESLACLPACWRRRLWMCAYVLSPSVMFNL